MESWLFLVSTFHSDEKSLNPFLFFDQTTIRRNCVPQFVRPISSTSDCFYFSNKCSLSSTGLCYTSGTWAIHGNLVCGDTDSSINQGQASRVGNRHKVAWKKRSK